MGSSPSLGGPRASSAVARRLLPDALVGGGSREEREVPARPGSPAPEQRRRRQWLLRAEGRSPGPQGHSRERAQSGAGGRAGGDGPSDHRGHTRGFRFRFCLLGPARLERAEPSPPPPTFWALLPGTSGSRFTRDPSALGFSKLARIPPRNAVKGGGGKRKVVLRGRSKLLLSPPPAAVLTVPECPRGSIQSVASTRDSERANLQSRSSHLKGLRGTLRLSRAGNFYSLRECTRSRCQMLLMAAHEPGSTCPDSVRQTRTQTDLGVVHSPGTPAGLALHRGWPEKTEKKGSGPTLKPGVPDINIAFRLFCLGKMHCIICQIEKAWCFPQQVNKLVVKRDGRRNTCVQ